jgi:hypothetical protein
VTVLPPLKWKASPNWSERGSVVDLVVVHRPVGSYQGSITVLCTPSYQASAHGVLGRPKPGAPLEFTQLVPWSKKAWACVAYNSRSDNLEIDDHAWDGTDPEAWLAAARITAYRLHVRKLKPRWARGGKGKGFCRHYDLGADGGGHTDPTTSTVKWLKFVFRVKWEFRRGDFAAWWGYDDAPSPASLSALKKPKPRLVKPKPFVVLHPGTTTAAGTAASNIHVTYTTTANHPVVTTKPKPKPKPKPAPKPKPKTPPSPAKPGKPKPRPKKKPSSGGGTAKAA